MKPTILQPKSIIQFTWQNLIGKNTLKAQTYFALLIIISNSILLPVKSEENNTSDIKEGVTLQGMAALNDLLPKNTKLKIVVNDDVNGEESQVGDEFTATVLNDLNVNDKNIIPVGSIIVGHVSGITHAGKASMQGTLDIAFDKILLPDGRYIPLSGTKFAADSKFTNMKRNLKGEGNGLARGVGLGVVKGASLTFIPGNKAVKTAAVGVAATGAVFSGGWSLTSTAAIGGLTGLYLGLKKYGKEVMIASGQEMEIVLDSSQDLSALAAEIQNAEEIQTSDSAESSIK